MLQELRSSDKIKLGGLLIFIGKDEEKYSGIRHLYEHLLIRSDKNRRICGGLTREDYIYLGILLKDDYHNEIRNIFKDFYVDEKLMNEEKIKVLKEVKKEKPENNIVVKIMKELGYDKNFVGDIKELNLIRKEDIIELNEKAKTKTIIVSLDRKVILINKGQNGDVIRNKKIIRTGSIGYKGVRLNYVISKGYNIENMIINYFMNIMNITTFYQRNKYGDLLIYEKSLKGIIKEIENNIKKMKKSIIEKEYGINKKEYMNEIRDCEDMYFYAKTREEMIKDIKEISVEKIKEYINEWMDL